MSFGWELWHKQQQHSSSSPLTRGQAQQGNCACQAGQHTVGTLLTVAGRQMSQGKRLGLGFGVLLPREATSKEAISYFNLG